MKSRILKSIFLFCILHFTTSPYSNAQIVYTDVIPDQNFSTNNSVYHLDLKNIGITDYDISIQTGGGVHPFANVLLTASTGNSVSVSSSLASALIFGDSVSSTNAWWTAVNYILSRDSWNINGHSGQFFHVITGNWLNATDKYLGLKFISGGNTYYGWARLDADVNSNGTGNFTIKDYAYNAAANQSILAGDRGNGINGIIHNNILKGHLSVFLNAAANNFTISFSNEQSEIFSLKIFDVNGRLIENVADNIFEAGLHQIEFNSENLKAGIYFLQMQKGTHLKTEKFIITK